MRIPNLGRFIRKRQEPDVDRAQALGVRPIRNPSITWERGDDGKVVLSIPIHLKPWMRLVRVLVRVPSERQVQLDEVASDVWEWLDGETTVQGLVERLAEAHKLHPREAEVSLVQFLQTLSKRRYVGLLMEGEVVPPEVQAGSQAVAAVEPDPREDEKETRPTEGTTRGR